MIWFINLASSGAAIISWIWQKVHLSTLSPSRLLCNIWCLSPRVDRMVVKVLVYSLYVVLAKAIGLWFVYYVGSVFLYRIL